MWDYVGERVYSGILLSVITRMGFCALNFDSQSDVTLLSQIPVCKSMLCPWPSGMIMEVHISQTPLKRHHAPYHRESHHTKPVLHPVTLLPSTTPHFPKHPISFSVPFRPIHTHSRPNQLERNNRNHKPRRGISSQTNARVESYSKQKEKQRKRKHSCKAKSVDSLHTAAATTTTTTTQTARERLMREQNRKQKEIPQAN
ncbi:hypothetical protein B9Z19DRAFT_1083068 [Tuber borchii]|uniref:Uncharacterized protein n=1 Tax=Tuber borchii TaxID=42251 RepID=A0A2T6ZTM6_TUBBO|nr:hypothetical protein B9Z19DRAFT_1083068 [Tuber borchii]